MFICTLYIYIGNILYIWVCLRMWYTTKWLNRENIRENHFFTNGWKGVTYFQTSVVDDMLYAPLAENGISPGPDSHPSHSNPAGAIYGPLMGIHMD